jgi:hypothetical protein
MALKKSTNLHPNANSPALENSAIDFGLYSPWDQMSNRRNSAWMRAMAYSRHGAVVQSKESILFSENT